MKPYLPVALDLVGERALVIGGDWEAADKADKLRRAEADVTLVTPEPGEEARALVARTGIALEERAFVPEDARGARVVVLTPRDPELARALREQGRREGFWLCAIDQPEHCDWVNVGVAEFGPIRIAISSGGGAPGLIKRLRQSLESGLGERFARFAARLAAHRESLADLPAAERRQRMTKALEGFRVHVDAHYPEWEADSEREPPP